MVRESRERRLEEDLRRVGLRVTTSRLAVLGLLRRARRPLSHADVVERLGEGAGDQATLYRNLVDLTEAGLLRMVMLTGRVQRYEPADRPLDDPRAHAHFVCTECGDVRCLPGIDVRIGDGDRDLPAAVTEGAVELQLRGRCNDCH
jgi:Fur family ferric uptake transcriptional regulator